MSQSIYAAPAPAHTFSQAEGGLFQVSGQRSMDPTTHEYIGADDIKAQTRRPFPTVRCPAVPPYSSICRTRPCWWRSTRSRWPDLMLARPERGQR
jgi:hypothetical protein